MEHTRIVLLTAIATSPEAPKIVRLWQDKVRTEQMARLQALELQPGDKYGQAAWEMAYEQWRNLPEGARIDLPSPRVFGRVLGLFRTGATLKTGKLLRLETSAQDIADLLGYSKSTVEAALRWLGCGPIEHHGVQVSRGLGLIHRGRRTALAYLCGALRRVYRTSRLVLTALGRILLGLAQKAARERQKAPSRTNRAPRQVLPFRRQEKHVAGMTHAGGDADLYDKEPATDTGRVWLKRIASNL